jgi:hypothetical protein
MTPQVLQHYIHNRYSQYSNEVIELASLSISSTWHLYSLNGNIQWDQVQKTLDHMQDIYREARIRQVNLC